MTEEEISKEGRTEGQQDQTQRRVCVRAAGHVCCCTVRASTVFFLFVLLSPILGKSLATLPRMNPQPPGEPETDGWREQDGLHELSAGNMS